MISKEIKPYTSIHIDECNIAEKRMSNKNTHVSIEGKSLSKVSPTSARSKRFLHAMSRFDNLDFSNYDDTTTTTTTTKFVSKNKKINEEEYPDKRKSIHVSLPHMDCEFADEESTDKRRFSTPASFHRSGLLGKIKAFEQASQRNIGEEQPRYRNSILDFMSSSSRKSTTFMCFDDTAEELADEEEEEEQEDSDIFSIPQPGDSLKVDPLGGFDVSFHMVYKLGDNINEGAFGVVYKGNHVLKERPEDEVAVKCIDRRSDADEKDAIEEASILRDIRDLPNIIKIIDFYKDDEKIYMVQELARGGDVFDRLVDKETYTESDARDLANILFTTIQSLHDRKIIHRDLKPENLLLKDMVNNSSILLCDFGSARYLPSDGSGMTTHCGTPEFIAPEVINGVEYRAEVDMWSAGCVLFMLLSGERPFEGDDNYETYQFITEADYGFDSPSWDAVSEEGKNLISNLLMLDQTERFTAGQALSSNWLSTLSEEELKSNDLTSSLDGIRYYCEHIRPDGVHFNCWRYDEEKSLLQEKESVGKTDVRQEEDQTISETSSDGEENSNKPIEEEGNDASEKDTSDTPNETLAASEERSESHPDGATKSSSKVETDQAEEEVRPTMAPRSQSCQNQMTTKIEHDEIPERSKSAGSFIWHIDPITKCPVVTFISGDK